MDLSTTCTQQEFGILIGISQQAVSDLLARGVIQPGHAAGQWLLAYTAHLREQAAGRGADGELATNRAAESRARTDLLEIRLAERRKEVAPVTVLEQILAHLGSQLRSNLEGLPATLKMRCPALGPDEMEIIHKTIAATCNLAATASLSSLDAMDEEAGIDG